MSNKQKEYTDYRKVIGLNIKYLLHQKGLSQSDFADSLQMPKSQLNRYILGKTMPSPEILADIAQQLDTTVEYVLALHQADAPIEISPTEKNSFDLSSELKAEATSCIGYCNTLINSSNSDQISSIANLLKQKISFISANI